MSTEGTTRESREALRMQGGNVPLRNVAPASLGGLDRNSRSDNGAPRNTEADVRPPQNKRDKGEKWTV